MEQTVEVSFEISVADLPASHSAFELAVADLLDEARGIPGVEIEELAVASPGNKGAVTKWVAKALTPGGDNAIVQLFRLWLERDRRRSVEVSITVPAPGTADTTVIRVTGEQVSLEVLNKALEAAVVRVKTEGAS